LQIGLSFRDWSYTKGIMINYKRILSLVSLLFLMTFGILVWRISVLFNDFAGVFPDAETGSEIVLETETTSHKGMISLNKSPQIEDNNSNSSNFGYYETIEQTVARIKKDVVVTGSIVGEPGEEMAYFQIEGMPDRSFTINTQLMDGFIITEITNHHVVLKNQTGNETISLMVR
jgi:hypothetical protein